MSMQTAVKVTIARRQLNLPQFLACWGKLQLLSLETSSSRGLSITCPWSEQPVRIGSSNWTALACISARRAIMRRAALLQRIKLNIAQVGVSTPQAMATYAPMMSHCCTKFEAIFKPRATSVASRAAAENSKKRPQLPRLRQSLQVSLYTLCSISLFFQFFVFHIIFPASAKSRESREGSAAFRRQGHRPHQPPRPWMPTIAANWAWYFGTSKART